MLDDKDRDKVKNKVIVEVIIVYELDENNKVKFD